MSNKKFKARLSKIMKVFRKLRVCDRFLLVIMAILLFQLAFNLFQYELYAAESSPVDTIVRTTASAVFGYFIGGGFLGRKNYGCQECDEESEANKIPEKNKNVELRKTQQITIISIIGIFALVVLIIAGNTGKIKLEAFATISQLRGFVSESIGLLVGYCSHSD